MPSFLVLRGYGDPSISMGWWCLAGVAVLATAVCFAHAALGFVVGRSAAANFFKIVLGVLLVGMIVWVVRETGGRGR